MGKPRIVLWGQEGAIVLAPTGIEYTNQTGGCCCMHPVAEGVFLSTPPEVELSAHLMLDTPPGYYDPLEVSYWLEHNGLDGVLEPLNHQEAEDLGHELMEAWVPARIAIQDVRHPWAFTLKTFDGEIAILTHRNSD